MNKQNYKMLTKASSKGWGFRTSVGCHFWLCTLPPWVTSPPGYSTGPPQAARGFPPRNTGPPSTADPSRRNLKLSKLSKLENFLKYELLRSKTMKHKLIKLLSRALAPSSLVLICALFGAAFVQAQSITPAGQAIENTASVDYEDLLGNSFTAISETAVVEVGAVFAATIESDELTVEGSPGNQSNIPFVLTNNANSADTFTLTVANDNGTSATAAADADTPEGDTVNGPGGSDIDATIFALFHDVNQNGVQDAGDIEIANNASTSGTLILQNGAGTLAGFPDNIGALVLVVDIPSSAVNEDQIGLIVTATSANTTVEDLTVGSALDGQGGFDAGDGGAVDPGERDDDGDLVADGDGSVQALITVTANALLDINKSAALDAANNRISYTLSVTNNGAAVANDIRIVDMIPTGTTFEEMEQINLSPITDGFFDPSASSGMGAFVLFTAGQDAASAPFPIGGLEFQFDSDESGTITPADSLITPQTVTEPTGVDLNDDGTTGGSFTGLEFLRATLNPTSSVSVVYTVSYDPIALGAGFDVENTFCVQGDLDNDAIDDTEICSNNVIIDIPTIYAVSADDTAGNGTPDSTTLIDDEDGVDNDTQHESSAAAGEAVQFTNVITNNGNAADSFDLSIDTGASNTFPAGTTFSFFLGGSPLAGNTGSIPAGGSVSITVQADLPSALTDGMATLGGISTVSFDEDQALFYIESGTDGACIDTNSDGCYDGAAGADGLFDTADDEVFFAQLTAESTNDPAGIPASDTKDDTLGAIRQGVADLANSSITQDVLVNADAVDDITDGIIDNGDGIDDAPLNQALAGTDGGDADNDIISTQTASPGTTVTFPLFLRNEQGTSASFTVEVDETITSIPTGWDVIFRPAGGGMAFTSTPVSIAENSEFAFQAEVVIPSDGALAASGTYAFAFMITSNADSAITDVKIDAVTVSALCQIDASVGGSDQVQQLGTVDYAHTVTNNGNEQQTISLQATLSEIVTGPNNLAGWTATIRVDTDEDGDVDADYSLLDPVLDPTVSLSIQDASAGNILMPVVLTGTVGSAVITLDPGDSIDFEIRVFAPSGADVNDQVRVTTEVIGGCEAAQIIDDTTIALQVRIDKEVAVDPGCTCEEDGAGVSGFLQDQTGTTDVNPGQCLIWRLTVSNEGTETANNVVVADQITPFSVAVDSGNFTATNPSGNTVAPAASTFYQVCADEFAAGSSCDLSANLVDASDATGNELVNVSGSAITFNVGTGSDNTTGGSLAGSNRAVAQFCVQVQ